MASPSRRRHALVVVSRFIRLTVSQIRSVVEPVTREALNQLAPVVRQVSDMPKDDISKTSTRSIKITLRRET